MGFLILRSHMGGILGNIGQLFALSALEWDKVAEGFLTVLLAHEHSFSRDPHLDCPVAFKYRIALMAVPA